MCQENKTNEQLGKELAITIIDRKDEFKDTSLFWEQAAQNLQNVIFFDPWSINEQD